MKNKIEKDAIQKRNYIDFIDNVVAYDQNYYSGIENKQTKNTSKMVKGKVKVYKKSLDSNFSNYANFEEEFELNLISKRMLLFLKITVFFMAIITVFLVLKKMA